MMAGRASEWERGAWRLFAHPLPSHSQPSEVNFSGCFHLDNSFRRSTYETHEYTRIADVIEQTRSPRTPELLRCSAIRLVCERITPPPNFTPMAPTKNSKAAKSTESIAARLALVKSGKYTLGYKSALKQMRSGKGLSNSVALGLGLGPEVPMLRCPPFSMSCCQRQP